MKTVLFDLDGTLHDMDPIRFRDAYFSSLIADFASYGYSPKAVESALSEALTRLCESRGDATGEHIFIECFTAHCDPDFAEKYPIITERYYSTVFDTVSNTCAPFPWARELLDRVHALGLTTVLATNPIFPRPAVLHRIAWAGLCPEDFSLITTYEDFCNTKSSLNYYRDILDKIGAAPEECLMVGNDADADMIAERLGMRVFLLTDSLVNCKNLDISRYPCGGYPELLRTIEEFALA